ncbi:hypothetical protein BSKO_11951 [Bryopsis sp. KO-2023]|nr:hypothetical protein BSKO_11951 [Bryopsis sp. KO-2023]
MKSIFVRGSPASDGCLCPPIPHLTRVVSDQSVSLCGRFRRRCVRRASGRDALSQSAQSSAETKEMPVVYGDEVSVPTSSQEKSPSPAPPSETNIDEGPVSKVKDGVDESDGEEKASKAKFHSLHGAPKKKAKNEKFAKDVNEIVNAFVNGTADEEAIKSCDHAILIGAIKLIMVENDAGKGHAFLEKLIELGKADDHIIAVYLKQCCLKDKLDFAQQCVDLWLREGNVPVGPGCSDVMIRSFMEKDELDLGLEMLTSFQEAGITLRPFAYNILIQVSGRQGRLDKAVDLFDQLLNSSEGPDAFSYRNVLWAIRASQAKRSLSLVYSQFKQEKDIPLDKNLYYAFMTCASRCTNIEVAEGIFESFIADEVQYRSPKVFNVLLDVYSKAEVLPDLDRIFGLFDKYSIKMDDFSFGLLLTSAYRCQTGLENICRITDEMDKRGVELNPLTAASLIIAYKGAGMDPFKERFKKSVEICRKVRTQTCYHLLMAMTSENGYLSLALRFQHEMEELGYTSNKRTFNILYEGCMQSGLVAKAEKFRMLRDERTREEKAKFSQEGGGSRKKEKGSRSFKVKRHRVRGM